jgi:cell pole-organizing protein PopZ
MSEQAAPEPTMEEILASIRRIISEDDDGPADETEHAAELAVAESAPALEPPTAFAEEEQEDVLELTERVAAPEPAPALEAAAPPEPAAEIETHPKAKPEVARMPEVAESLVSQPSATAAASAFGRLTAAVAMPEAGMTLEDVTKELLRPLLKAWLDENLPRIVEAKVADEVERVSRGRVR